MFSDNVKCLFTSVMRVNSCKSVEKLKMFNNICGQISHLCGQKIKGWGFNKCIINQKNAIEIPKLQNPVFEDTQKVKHSSELLGLGNKCIYINQLTKCNHLNIWFAISVHKHIRDAIPNINSKHFLYKNTHTQGHTQIGRACALKNTLCQFMIHINQMRNHKCINSSWHFCSYTATHLNGISGINLLCNRTAVSAHKWYEYT